MARRIFTCSQQQEGWPKFFLCILLGSGGTVLSGMVFSVTAADLVLAQQVSAIPVSLEARSSIVSPLQPLPHQTVAEAETDSQVVNFDKQVRAEIPADLNSIGPAIISDGVSSLAADLAIPNLPVPLTSNPISLNSQLQTPITWEALPKSVLGDNLSLVEQPTTQLSQAGKPSQSPSPSSNQQTAPAQNQSETPEAQEDPDLGRLRLRERRVPPRQPQPILHLVPRISYFYTNNVFSGVDPVKDSLFFPGLTLWSLPELKPGTYLIGSIDGNLIRYVKQSEFDYNYLRFRAGVYQRITPRMYGELGWSNQQYFRASNGDRFLNEHSVYLSLSRRDWLNKKWALDSFYDVRLSFADPDNRSRLSNYFSLSLSYYFKPNLLAGFDYQLSFWDFTKQDRQDLYHRLLGNFNYGLSKDSQINLQAGISLGGSTNENIDYNGLFMSITYSVDWQVF